MNGRPTPPRTRRDSGFQLRAVFCDEGTLLARGDDALKDGDATEAARCFQHAVSHADNPRAEATAYLRLGEANRALGRDEAAVHCFRRAIEATPGWTPPYIALIAWLAESDDWPAVDRVERDLFAELPEGERRADALVASGDRWWYRAGERGRARQRYREALRSAPDHESAALRLQAAAQSGRREGLARLRFTARQAPSARARAEAWLTMGQRLWFEDRRFDEAIAALTSAREADPTLLAALEMLVVALVERRRFVRLESVWRAATHDPTIEGVAARATIRETLRNLGASIDLAS